MTEADRALLEHLAEKVRGWKPWDIDTRDSPPGYPCFVSQHGWIRVYTGPGDGRVWPNPLEDANAALEVLLQPNINLERLGSQWVAREYYRKNGTGGHSRSLGVYHDFCRAVCLAAAKATGYKETT